MKPPFVRNPYNYDTNKASDEAGLLCEDPSLTQQSFAEEADINTIVRRFKLTGQLPSNVRAPEFGEFTESRDFHELMNFVVKANESFEAMPAEVRYRFHNDPAEFVDFCSDLTKRDEAAKLGLVFKGDSNEGNARVDEKSSRAEASVSGAVGSDVGGTQRSEPRVAERAGGSGSGASKDASVP